jgi:hypothetical protein
VSHRTHQLPGITTTGSTATVTRALRCCECNSALRETFDGTLCCTWRMCGAYGTSVYVEDDEPQEDT